MQADKRPEQGKTTTMLPPMMCSKEVMSFLNIVSRHTLRLMVARGKFPQPIRMNTRFQRWRREDVQKWYEEASASEPDPHNSQSH